MARLAAYPSAFLLWGLTFPSSRRELACRIWLAPTELDQDLSTQTTFCLG